MLFPALIQFLAPLALYYCVLLFTNPDYRFSPKDLVYAILPLLYLIMIILERTLEADIKIWMVVLLLCHGLLYSILSLLLLRKHKAHIEQFASSTHEIDLSWLEHILGAVILMIASVAIFNLVFFEMPLNAFMNGLVLLIIFFIAYHSLKQKEIFPVDDQERADIMSISDTKSMDASRAKILSEEKLVELKALLNDLMISKEPYLDSELSLSNRARQLMMTTHQLSYVINAGYDENFYGFINKFRVEKAKRLLLDNEANKFSMLGIAFESGFNSKTSFNTAFKKITGKTPSEFKERRSGL